jgi:hypothetical protein
MSKACLESVADEREANPQKCIPGDGAEETKAAFWLLHYRFWLWTFGMSIHSLLSWLCQFAIAIYCHLLLHTAVEGIPSNWPPNVEGR